MPDKLPVYGFLGNAPTTWENIHAQLASDLPDDAIFIVPTKEHLEFGCPNLIPVVTWLRDNYDAGDTRESFTVLETLKEYLDRGHQITLIMLWDENDAIDQANLQIAHEAGIPVLDLPHGMFALPPARPATMLEPVTFDDSPPGDEDKKESPRLASLLVDEPPWDTGELKAFSDDEVLTALRSFIQQIIHKELKDMGLIPGINKVPQIAPISDTDEDQRIIDAFTRPVTGIPAPPMPADVQPTTKWVRGADGVHVRRRPGRLAKGLEVVSLTEAQIRELKAVGKIHD